MGVERVDGHRKMGVQVARSGRKVDHARDAYLHRVVNAKFIHHLAGAIDDPGNARFTDEQAMRFFGQHGLAGALKRVEAGSSQGI